jgi:general secretion pathway protein G
MSMMGKRTKRRHAAHKAEQGYTLLELLVVIGVLGLLVAFAAPRVIGYFERSKAKAAEIQIATLAAALDLYRLDVGDYPSEAHGLKALVEKPADQSAWRGPYITRRDGIIDPWERPYLYAPAAQGKTLSIRSLGADGKEGGEGDDADIANAQ